MLGHLPLSLPAMPVTQELHLSSSCFQQGYHNARHGAHVTRHFHGIIALQRFVPFQHHIKERSLDTSMSTFPLQCDLLSPFALYVNFSHTLVERDFHDYFSDSLTLPVSRTEDHHSTVKYGREVLEHLGIAIQMIANNLQAFAKTIWHQSSVKQRRSY